jgi:predicted PhzF superfamily epimerase YddE/YHI9
LNEKSIWGHSDPSGVQKYVGKNRWDYLGEVDSEKTVRGLKPNFALLATIPVRGVMVTSRPDSRAYDFVSRFFGPRSGINEDPVTGSAHCCLGPFWKARRTGGVYGIDFMVPAGSGLSGT